MHTRSEPVTPQAPGTLVIGGRGAMAQRLARSLPGAPRIVDLQDHGCERRVRRISRAFLRPGRPSGRDGLRRAVFCSVPQRLYGEAARLSGRRAALLRLLGSSGAGQGGVLLVPCASLLAEPTGVLAGAAGPVVGLHLLYGPQVSDLSRETAILAAPARTQRHHLYPQAQAFLHQLLAEMGHRQILALSPEQHDRLMADVQFLTHSLFLSIAAAVREAQGGSAYDPARLASWLDDLLQFPQRMLRQQPHVYAGIARQNPHNAALLSQLRSSLAVRGRGDLTLVVRDLIRATTSVAAEFRRHSGLAGAAVRSVKTPVHRYRAHLASHLATLPGGTSGRYHAAAAVTAYATALQGDYESWLRDLADWFPARAAERSDALLAELDN